MSDRKRLNSRSNQYQFKFTEIQVNFQDWAQDMENKGGMASMLSFKQYGMDELSPQFNLINDMIIDRLFEIAKVVLTQHQYDIFMLMCDGYTQKEVCKILGLAQQSGVHKSLFGNAYTDSKKLEGDKKHGGVDKKLIKTILLDDKIKELCYQIQLVDDLFYKRDVLEGFEEDLQYQPKKQLNINMYFIISTFFKHDDEFQDWINGKIKYDLPKGGSYYDQLLDLSIIKEEKKSNVIYINRKSKSKPNKSLKLTQDMRTVISGLFKNGWSIARLAKHYKVSESTVRRSLKGENHG